jgi:hypothetical protein
MALTSVTAPSNAPTLSVDDASNYARQTLGINSESEPGFANTYGRGAANTGGLLLAALPAAGVTALSLYWLQKRKQQDARKAKKQSPEKQASLISQIPGLHPKDILLGATVGGGAGLLYDALAKHDPNEARLPKALKRIIGGAAIGGVGANIIGDRARRYISNTVLPVDYGVSNKLQQLKPKSFKHFVDAAIYDKPVFDGQLAAGYQTAAEIDPKTFGAMVLARRELQRIGFGVERPGAESIWQRNRSGKGPEYYSLNEKNPLYEKLRERLFGAESPTARGILSDNTPSIVESAKIENATNKQEGGWKRTGLFGSDTLLGGQQVIIPDSNSPKVIGRVLDRYDVTPANDEMNYATNAVRNLNILKPSWWAEKPELNKSDRYGVQTNKEFVGSLLARLVWDRILTEKHPWVSQQFSIDRSNVNNPLQLLRENGTP